MLVKVGARPCPGQDGIARVGFVFGDRRHPQRFTEWWEGRQRRGRTDGATAADFS